MTPVTLYCLPHAGGGISAYAGWREDAPANLDVRPVRLPGRDGNDAEPRHRMAELVDTLAGEPAALPYALFGHSVGAVVAFELARTRSAAGNAPTRLFVSGSVPPSRAAKQHDEQRHLSDDEFVARVEQLGGVPPDLLADPGSREVLLPRLRADYALAETYDYQPGPPLDCPISAFAGRDDHTVAAADLDDWAGHTTAGFRRRLLPGDHFYLSTARPLLLRAIARDLEV
ncbi:thioesterase domain-containing protein [Saccharothrix sp. AJ9571]|nr:thioesterase domain-containing protein [Saccharothrix sp. AJ9571]